MKKPNSWNNEILLFRDFHGHFFVHRLTLLICGYFEQILRASILQSKKYWCVSRSSLTTLHSRLLHVSPPPPPLPPLRPPISSVWIWVISLVWTNRLVDLVFKQKIRCVNPAGDRIFPGRVMPVTSELALQWLPCQAPGVVVSALGLVGPVSVYWLGEVESWIRSFYLSVAARKIICSRSVPEIH